MRKYIRWSFLALALAAGAAPFILAAADPSDPQTICFRGRTIQVPQYLASRYLAVVGSTNGACPTTP